MTEEFLSFNNSEQFRKKLVARNLAQYTVPGNFGSTQGLQNYPIKLQDNSPSDSESVSVELYIEPAKNTRMNLYGPVLNNEAFINNAEVVNRYLPPEGYEYLFVT